MYQVLITVISSRTGVTGEFSSLHLPHAHIPIHHSPSPKVCRRLCIKPSKVNQCEVSGSPSKRFKKASNCSGRMGLGTPSVCAGA